VMTNISEANAICQFRSYDTNFTGYNRLSLYPGTCSKLRPRAID